MLDFRGHRWRRMVISVTPIVFNIAGKLALFDTGNGDDPSSSAAVVSWQSTSYRIRSIS